MFVGVVVENFHRCREAHEKEEREKREERRLRKLAKKIASKLADISLKITASCRVEQYDNAYQVKLQFMVITYP